MEPADFSSDEVRSQNSFSYHYNQPVSCAVNVVCALQEEVLGLGSESDEDDEEINEYERRLQSLRSKGFKEQLGSDLEDEAEDDGQ